MNKQTNSRSRRNAKKRSAGFSLVEIMVVVIIIGMLATLVGVNVMGRLERARVQQAVTQIKILKNALDTYKMDNKRYPTTEQGLKALVQMPTIAPQPTNYDPQGYLDASSIPLDPWDNEYVYWTDGANAYVKSLGPDGLDNTEDDIVSWDLRD